MASAKILVSTKFSSLELLIINSTITYRPSRFGTQSSSCFWKTIFRLEFSILVHSAVEYRRKSEDPREATVSKLVDIPFSSCFGLYIVPKA